MELEGGSVLQAVTYYLVTGQEEDRRPSAVYKDVIVRGAEEHGVPSHYVDWLRSIQDNGYSGEVSLGLDLRQRSAIPD